MFKRVCVFCGSSFGNSSMYQSGIQELGRTLTSYGIELVYGGGNVGLMGELARSVLAQGGRVTGIIPKKIYENVQHIELTELIVVENMHERKANMYELADAFIALPGGVGTLEELAEVMTWQQIGYHAKPIGLLNINEYYKPFVALLTHMHQEGFLKQQYIDSLVIESDPSSLLEEMLQHEVPNVNKWGL